MVRLKELCSVANPALRGFQFHNGSIKGGNVVRIVGKRSLFQFHNGSIKGPMWLLRG